VFRFLLVLIVVLSAMVFAQEITIFDSYGDAEAYVVVNDEETIYLWSGAPVGYLVDDLVYGFNGEPVSWYEDGIFYDLDGYVIGFIEGAISAQTNIEPLKGLKSLKPLKSLKELKPLKPLFRVQWSDSTLVQTLMRGAK
jgi:hypothetical protein